MPCARTVVISDAMANGNGCMKAINNGLIDGIIMRIKFCTGAMTIQSSGAPHKAWVHHRMKCTKGL